MGSSIRLPARPGSPQVLGAQPLEACDCVAQRWNPRAMQIFIKTLTGRKTNFNFELDNTVRHVKEALQEKEGIQVEQIRLIYSGKQMSDECTLADYNVKPGSTVHMVLQLRG